MISTTYPFSCLGGFFPLRATGLTKNMLGVGQECGPGRYFEGGLPDLEAACWLCASEILIMALFSSFVFENVNLACRISASAYGAEHFNTSIYESLTLVPCL